MKVYCLTIENISSRKMKTYLIAALKIGNPEVAVEIVNGKTCWARCYRAASWLDVETVLMKSQEKDTLQIVKEGDSVAKSILQSKKLYIWGMKWNCAGPMDNWINKNDPMASKSSPSVELDSFSYAVRRKRRA